MVAVAITAMGDGGYYANHARRDLAAAQELGDYYVKGSGDGEPAAVFTGRALDTLGISRNETPERAAQLMTDTWTNLRNPITGESLGTAVRQYANTAENLAKAATTAGVVLPKHLQAKNVRASAVTLGDVTAHLQLHLSTEEVRELTAKAKAAQRQNRSFYDITVSSDKSLSVLHVAAEKAGNKVMSDAIEASLLVASEAITEFVADELGTSRIGYHGKKVGGQTSGMRVRNSDLAVASHIHHTSREGDPQDHVHALVLNRGIDANGDWHALDGQPIFLARPMLQAIGSRAQEFYLAEELGLRFESSGNGMRRVVGVDQDICDVFSKRRAVILLELNEWAERTRERTGVEPTAKERTIASQKIARRTRKAKVHEGRDELLEKFGKEADERGKALEEVHDSVLAAVAAGRLAVVKGGSADDTFDRDQVITNALDKLASSQSHWNRYQLYKAIDAELPDNWTLDMTPDRLHDLTLKLTAEGLAREGLTCLMPDQPLDVGVPRELADERGFSMFLARDREIYAPTATLDAEEALLLRASALGAPKVDAAKAKLLAEKSGLGEDQADAFVGLMTSGRRLEVLIGPAGTGKSFTMAKLAKHWHEASGVKDNVLGLTVSQNAAEVLMGEGFPVAMNLARWTKAQQRIASARAEGRPVRKSDQQWVVRKGQLIVVDEASMANTEQLSMVLDLADAQGAKVLFAGDDRQLDAIGAGGALSLLVGDEVLSGVGAIHTLSQVRRFREQDGTSRDWEAAASLAMRLGDAEALAVYDHHGRIVSGELEAVTAAAVDDAVTAHLTGKSSLLITGTAEEAAELSMRVRKELVAAGLVDGSSALRLGDGSTVSVGDIIQTRKNSPLVLDADGKAVTNRDVFTVIGLGGDGSIVARRRAENGELGTRMTLPADYAAKEVELAYAATVHAAQGRTVDVAGIVVSVQTTLKDLYVGMTRGRKVNRAYVLPGGEGDDREALDLLVEVMGRDESIKSVTAMKREQDDASVSLARLGPAWGEAVSRLHAEAYRSVIEPMLAKAGLLDALNKDPAADAFWASIAAVDAEGYDPAVLLASTLERREVAYTGESVARVLHYRMTTKAHMDTPVLRADVSTELESLVLEVDQPKVQTREERQGAVARRLMAAGLWQSVQADPAAPTFWRAVDTVAANGYDPVDVVSSTLKGREVSQTARFPARVLHYRLENMADMAWEPQRSDDAALQVQAHQAARPATARVDQTYLDRSPAPESLAPDLAKDKMAAYSRYLAATMDARVEELGRRTAESAPEWATTHLGSVPPPLTTAREDWERRAGAVAAYLEQHVEDTQAIKVADPIGRAPSAAQAPHRRADWQRANSALGLDREAMVDIRTESDLALDEAVQTWEEARNTAPPWVKPMLDEAHEKLRRSSNTYDRQLAEVKGQPGRHVKALGEQVAAQRQAVEALQAKSTERADWYESTAEVRERACEARKEQIRREPFGTAEKGLSEAEEAPATERRRVERAPLTVREEMAERDAERYDRQARMEAQRLERSEQRSVSVSL